MAASAARLTMAAIRIILATYRRAHLLFADARHKPGRITHVLALGALLSVAGRRWLRFLRFTDWAWFFAWAVRHPRDLVAGLSGPRHFAELWTYLDRHTARQAAQAAPLP
jgi:hypothetical protein